SREILILDGGFSTQLSHNVEEKVDGNPLWTAHFLYSDPEAIVKTHLDFLRAGADVLITNTYQASIGGFMEHLGLSESESYNLIKTAVQLAKQAISAYNEEEKNSKRGVRKILIAGSIGPYGASLHDGSEYSGNYVEFVSEEEIKEWHRPRIETVVDAGVDLLAFETIPSQKEAEVLLNLLKEYPQQRAWISFTCKDEFHTSHGETFEDVVSKCSKINPSQIVAFGINCTKPKFISSLICDINSNRLEKIPLIVYPNKGETYDVEKGWIGAENCKPLESYIPEWLDLGVVYIGGCCRTQASDIEKIKAAVEKWTLQDDV
ncbi:hypothetical protein L9F63_005639, partial [Diploptera punctata]